MPGKDSPVRFVSEPDSAPQPSGSRRMSTDLPFLDGTETVTLDVRDARMGLSGIMPAAWAISEHLTDLAVEREIAQGGEISCRKGCDECCRAYFVTCSPPEAFRILDDVNSLGSSAKQRHLSSLAVAADRYAKSGVAQAAAARDSDDSNAGSNIDISAAYWRENKFDCPILRDGACSLYESRPTACREFLVTSPAELCASYNPARVPIPFSMEMTLSIWAGRIEQLKPTMIPLVNILAWSTNKATRAARTWRAPQIARTFLEVLTERAETAAERK